jgi:hypothetical protein
MSNASFRKLLLDLDSRLIVHDDHLELSCNSQLLRKMLVRDFRGDSRLADRRLNISMPASFRKRGHGIRLVVLPGHKKPDHQLVKLLVQARAARTRLFAKGDISSYNRRRLTQLARLSYLAPDIVIAILNGKQPEDVTSGRLRRLTFLPLSWKEQRRLLGFPAVADANA